MTAHQNSLFRPRWLSPVLAIAAAAAWIASAQLASQSKAAEPMQYPLAVAAVEAGVVYVGDRNLPGVWKIEGGKRTLLFQGSKKFRTPLNAVRCLSIDIDGSLLAGDSSTRDVYRFNAQGEPQPLLKGENAGIGIPMDIVAAKNGDLLVSDLEIHRIWKIPKAGGAAEVFAEVPAPTGLFLDSQDRLWVVSRGKNSLYRVDAEGKVETVVEGRAFEFPHNIVLDADGAAYISDGYAKAIWKMPAGEKPQKWAQHDGFGNPVDLAWRGDKLLVVDPRAGALFEVAPDGAVAKFATD